MSHTFVLIALLARAQAPDTPAPPPLVRRGVETAPRIAPEAITIHNSGSTNFSAYTLVVHQDGAVDVTVQGATTSKTLAAPQTKWLFDRVRAATPLDTMARSGCMKSASFGTSTTVSYGGTTSPDVTCGGDAVLREIARTVGVIVTQLDVRPGRTMLRPTP
jgi:hypothetical protein